MRLVQREHMWQDSRRCRSLISRSGAYPTAFPTRRLSSALAIPERTLNGILRGGCRRRTTTPKRPSERRAPQPARREATAPAWLGWAAPESCARGTLPAVFERADQRRGAAYVVYRWGPREGPRPRETATHMHPRAEVNAERYTLPTRLQTHE
jgi:hypothetical protein